MGRSFQPGDKFESPWGRHFHERGPARVLFYENYFLKARMRTRAQSNSNEFISPFSGPVRQNRPERGPAGWPQASRRGEAQGCAKQSPWGRHNSLVCRLLFSWVRRDVSSVTF